MMKQEIKRLYKILVSIFLLLAVQNIAKSCNCLNYDTFLNSAEQSTIVIEGTVLKHTRIESDVSGLGYSAVVFKVSRVHLGQNVRDTILVIESTGLNCITSNYIDDKRYFINGDFETIDGEDKNSNTHTFAQILFPSPCSESTLRIYNKEVCGKISLNINLLNRWYYKLTGDLREITCNKEMECMTIEELRKKIQGFKN